MARKLLPLLIALLAGAAALFIGLVGGALRTGWLDPLDWLLSGTAAALVLAWQARPEPGWRAGAMIWAVVTLPALLFLALAGTRFPWAGLLLLALGLAIAVLAACRALALGGAVRWIALAALLGFALVLPRIAGADGGGAAQGERLEVGVLSAMPLQGIAMGAAHGLPPAESIGMRSPLWRGLERRFALRPLDAIDAPHLADLRVLLLAQPRALAPAELVALDAWVRRGGRAVILADPLLHWPDPRPLAHPQRAPLTSLLDPLLAYWGLRLEPAEMAMDGDPVERRVLASGAVVQLSGASRFGLMGAVRACALAEHGLIARCRIGAGEALLVADADWINDMLWTLRPEHPEDRRAWTAATLDLLSAWLTGKAPRADLLGSWLTDRDALLASLRIALGLLLLIVVGNALVGRWPSRSQHHFGTKTDHFRNGSDTGGDTG
ncbi:MAG: Gldg family protein [Sphingomonadales bacterium]|nr:Gldg family protein [Sphingomonadales bacterium]